jgi:hypothetical protein
MLKFFFIEKYWEIIVCVNVGIWCEIIAYVDDVEMFFILKTFVK